MQDKALQVKRRISLCFILLLLLIAVAISFEARNDMAPGAARTLGSSAESAVCDDQGQSSQKSVCEQP